jgi:hypothetical protein
MRYEDGMAWFDDRFSDNEKKKAEKYEEDPFDILIMDALDPQDNIVSIVIAIFLICSSYFYSISYKPFNTLSDYS